MTILVTGAAGFIGSATVRALLAREEKVVGIDNLNDYYDPALKQARLEWIGKPSNFHFEKLDFADREAVRELGSRHRFDRIVHLGAQAGVRYSLESPHIYADANLVGQLNMLELARDQQPRHLVYASSSSVYGANRKMPFAVEDPVEKPVSLYAATKRSGELMAQSYAHLYRVPTTGLRFFTVYGPWGRPDMAMWLFTEALYRGETIRLFNKGQMKRDFTYIDDIVSGILGCLDQPPVETDDRAPHDLYNIGNNRPEELSRLVAILEKATGREAQIELAPMQPGDVEATYADIEPLRKLTGYAPTTTIEEGAPRFVRWYADYHDIDQEPS